MPSNNVWNTPIDKLPALPQTFVNTIGATKTLHADFGPNGEGIPFVTVPADQPAVPVKFDYSDESDAGPYPIPPNPPIEGNGAGDAHILILQTGTCKLFEIFAAALQPDGSWHAGSGAIFDLKSNLLRPDTWTSADAAGLPIYPGLVRYDEVASGSINHALRLTVPSTRKAHIWPARHDASRLTDAIYPPMGQRFRLRATYDVSGFPPEAQVILNALKKYGLILADNGSAWFITGAPDPRWNIDAVSTIRKVTGADLEAIDESSLLVSPDSGQAKGASIRTVVPYSPAPAFDLSLNTTASITLAGDVTSSTVANPLDGAVYTFLICQDQAGGHAFAWPANVFGGVTVNTAPGKCSAQQFVSDGLSLYATSPGSNNM